MNIAFNTPVLFRVIRWDENWEFDCPTVLVLPIERYSPSGTYCESMIEDAASDIALSLEAGGPLVSKRLNAGEVKEFKWRGWNMKRLRRYAELIRRGELTKVPKRYRHAEVVDEWIEFSPPNANGEVAFKTVEPPV